MKKLLYISDKPKMGLLGRIVQLFVISETLECSTGIHAENFIQIQKPDYILTDISKPVNGTNMMNTLRQFDGNDHRLRVSVFYLTFSKKNLPQTTASATEELQFHTK